MRSFDIPEGFHYLIEIAVNLDKYLDLAEKYHRKSDRQSATYWREKLKQWKKDNYDNAGLREEYETFKEEVEAESRKSYYNKYNAKRAKGF